MWQGHRFVVLPDYQGIGIGGRLLDALGADHLARGERFVFTAISPALFGAVRGKSWWARGTNCERGFLNPAGNRRKILNPELKRTSLSGTYDLKYRYKLSFEIMTPPPGYPGSTTEKPMRVKGV